MLLYLLPLIIGFIGGVLYMASRPTFFETAIMSNLKLGKKIILCVDDEATIFEMVGTKVRISKGLANFYNDPVEAYDDSMDDSGSNQSH